MDETLAEICRICPPRLHFVVRVRRRPRSSISDSSNAIGPSPPHSPRGRSSPPKLPSQLYKPNTTSGSPSPSPQRRHHTTVFSSAHLGSAFSFSPYPGPGCIEPHTLVPASHFSSTFPQASLNSCAHASHHPNIPPSSFNPSLPIPSSTATAAPLAPIQTTAASTVTHGGTSSQNPFFLLPHLEFPPSLHSSPSSRLLLPPPLSPPAFQPHSSHSYTSSTPYSISKTIPELSALGQQILSELTAPEFTIAFSLYHNVICSTFPDRRSELDHYLSLIIDLALWFGGNCFYLYHILFTSQTTERLQQFNQGTY
ncbi:hypothetical protein D5F01_LYC03533 [Larimichthys crocea]|uniref:Uncharacterized protein n=1 Tax=Larimichthys crocea TaxID=215358 RepID=A0A6G0J053_LARCR|nr:hypothetical protein D5F01_LYC03533 [Larimichthys crocea]